MLGATSAAVISLSLLAASPAISDTITYVTPTGATTSGPVNASATFTTGMNSITVTLSNLQPNITDVAQALSDLSFTYSGSSLPSASLSSSSGQEINVAGNGSSTTGATVAAGWVLSSSGNTVVLDDLSGPGHAGPAHVIIGPPGPGGTYSNANGSIAGNGPHNPFLNETAMFVISLTGITADTTITSVIFSFGTTAGVDVPGVPSTVPLPGALPLFATGIGLMGVLRWKKKRKVISA